MDFQIRPATETDVPVILELIRGIAAYEKMSGEVVATEQTLRASMFERRRAAALLAQENGKTVGFALYFYNFSTFIGREGIWLEDLFVWPEHRGKGYGKALMQALARVAQAECCSRLEWTCLDWNQPSIAFYRSLGARAMDEWTTYRLITPEIQALAHSQT